MGHPAVRPRPRSTPLATSWSAWASCPIPRRPPSSSTKAPRSSPSGGSYAGIATVLGRPTYGLMRPAQRAAVPAAGVSAIRRGADRQRRRGSERLRLRRHGSRARRVPVVPTSAPAPSAAAAPAPRTFAAVRAMLLAGLSDRGWTVKRDLKVPWASKGEYRLWFKPQAIYHGATKAIADARPLSSDMREYATVDDLLQAVERHPVDGSTEPAALSVRHEAIPHAAPLAGASLSARAPAPSMPVSAPATAAREPEPSLPRPAPVETAPRAHVVLGGRAEGPPIRRGAATGATSPERGATEGRHPRPRAA